ncbi:MAG: hypothetical protein H7A06_01130 [Pseudomonadales bacterium]|nr:hypothetical protein [Pseudomonadales bacterium]
MSQSEERPQSIEQRLARMPGVAEGDFTNRVMLRLARRRLRRQLVYVLAWGCALLGVMRTLPFGWLSEQINKSLMPITARGDSTLVSLQHLLSEPASMSAPEQWPWLLLAAGVALMALLLTALLD